MKANRIQTPKMKSEFSPEFCEWCRCAVYMGHDEECIFRRDVVEILPH